MRWPISRGWTQITLGFQNPNSSAQTAWILFSVVLLTGLNDIKQMGNYTKICEGPVDIQFTSRDQFFLVLKDGVQFRRGRGRDVVTFFASDRKMC